MAKKEEHSVEPVKFKLKHCFYIAGILLILLALFSHDVNDYAVLEGGREAPLGNWIGSIGAHLSCILFYLFGLAAYPIVILLAVCALRPLLPFSTSRRGYSGALCAIILGTTILFAIEPQNFSSQTANLGIGRSGALEAVLSGGVIGQVLAAPPIGEIPPGYLRRFIGAIGAIVVALVFLLAGVLFLWFADWHIPFKKLLSSVENVTPPTPSPLLQRLASRENKTTSEDKTSAETPLDNARQALLALRQRNLGQEPSLREEEYEKGTPVSTEAGHEFNSADPVIRTTVQGKTTAPPEKVNEYVLPPVTMLGKGSEVSGESEAAIERSKLILQQTLESFNVEGKVTGTVSGPRVTRYEISLAPGVKVEKVSNIGNNIAMELEAQSIRILTPIPGKNAVGVESPNSRAEAVFLRSLMESDAWKKHTGELPIVLGKDVAGKSIILDLAKAPHLLIAGATGSGKSVCMNTLVMSLLFNFSPDELRLIMVDPKVVELEIYSTLPHLITPVVNDPHKVPVALRWVVNEMEKRYRILGKARVKNLKGYNTRSLPASPLLGDNDEPLPDKLPMLVIIIDELADVMMTDAKADVETSIARIAQKGRAAGIHIVIATQRPSTNIITGVIKANLPTRIAFRVGSIVDSRVILDQKGAETLLGRGDMLFVPPGSPNLERIQGAIVEDSDIAKVVDFVSSQAEQLFNHQVLSETEEPAYSADYAPGDEDQDDEASIYDAPEISPLISRYLEPGDPDNLRQALEIILLERKASTSYLQRRLKIGYNRAAELIDIFEERGIVGPPQPGGSKRDILVFDEIDNNL